MKYYESKDILNQKEIDFIKNNILGNNFPWYYEPVATTDKFQFFSHTLVIRETGEINSDYFNFFKNIFNRFCHQHSLKVNKITRGVLNLTNSSKYDYGDPHVDHEFKHKVFMLYLKHP